MTISNIINDISYISAWRMELMFILRYALIFIILIYLYSKNFINKQTITIFLFVALLIQCFDGIYQSIVGYDFFKDNLGSLNNGLTGAVSNRNTYGFLMGIGVCLTFIYLFKRSKVDLVSFFILIFLLMFSFTTLFSYSRGVWIALILSLLIYIVSQFKYLRAIHIVYFLLIASIISLLLANTDSLSSRINDLIALKTSNRDIIWLKAISLIKEQPIFGWGLDSWKIYGTVNYAGVHNSILEILLFTGILGLISFFSILYITLKKIYIYKQWELLFIIIFLIITSLFGHSIFKSKIYLSVVTILMFYVYSIKIEMKEQES
ncbi:O-antigen ligase family protein [Poseidonibacter sp.]|uniref:O-antigen ligase family protein n=1 Tax=Poseidonibacter sp. TaxID=2321188 RepID=UPI003C72F1CD